MRRVLPFLFMALFASSLFAQSSEDKSAKYGTRPLADNPEPYLYINPDYSQSFRSTDVLVNMGGGSWISETSWSIVAPVDADGDGVLDVVAEGAGQAYADIALSLDDGTYTVNMADSYGDGWNGCYLTVSDAATGQEYFFGTLDGVNDDGATGTGTFDLPQDVPIPGCTDAAACNYDEYASEDDGSCCYNDSCYDLVVDGGSWQSEVSWQIIDANGDGVLSGGAPFDDLACLEDGIYTVQGFDSYGDGWNGNVLTLYDANGDIALEFTFDEGDYAEATFQLPLSKLVLAAVLDLSLPEGGSTGKAVMVQALADIADLSTYGIGVANNGGGTDGQEYTFPVMALDSGEVLWVIRDEAAYMAYFGESLGNYVVDNDGWISQWVYL